jgi:hypothetical protein
MGKLVYADSELTISFEDRALVHVQIVIGERLQQNKGFYFSWKDDPAVGDGRSTVWMHPAIPLFFKFSGSRVPAINREWLTALRETADSGTGLAFVGEPGQPFGRTAPPQSHI